MRSLGRPTPEGLATRVAYVDHTAVLSGGELALSNLIAALDRRRWDPHVILGSDGPLVARLRKAGVPVEILPLPAILSGVRQDRLGRAAILHPLRALAALHYVRRLARHLHDRDIGLVHANSLKACILASLAARLAGRPSIWHIHSLVTRPMVGAGGVLLLRAMGRWLPQHVICNSAATAACFKLPASRLSVIPSGIDATHFPPNGQRGKENLRIGMIGRFAPWKGQHVFIDAVQQLGGRHPDAEFVLAGSPLFGEEAYLRQVQDRADRCPNRDRIRFLGFVEDIPGLLQDIDIVVHASIRPEPLGQVIIEAMMAGKPVVASAAGGPLELVEDGVTGRLVAPGDAGGLASALDGLMRDRAAAVSMGERARQRALQRYDLRQTSHTLERVYEKVLSQP
jgi:glycosyltransferase involved in cell wall biosynthesis